MIRVNSPESRARVLVTMCCRYGWRRDAPRHMSSTDQNLGLFCFSLPLVLLRPLYDILASCPFKNSMDSDFGQECVRVCVGRGTDSQVCVLELETSHNLSHPRSQGRTVTREKASVSFYICTSFLMRLHHDWELQSAFWLNYIPRDSLHLTPVRCICWGVC